VKDPEEGVKKYTYDSNGDPASEHIYTDSVNKNITEYVYNHLGKPEEKNVYIKEGDIYENDFNESDSIALSTIYTYD
jgi:hypothetical protein